MTELEKFDHKICEIQKKFDELQSEARAKEAKLHKLRDQLDGMQRESELLTSNVKDSPQAKVMRLMQEIRTLENRLDKAMIKYNETQSIKKTYELIVKRLQEERLTFDNQLANFEKSLRAKKQDASELEMMSRDANHAKEVARAELARFEQQVNEERKQREKDLQLRKEMVKHKMEVADKTDKRVAKQDDQNAEVSHKDDVVQFDEALEKKMSEYEETMRLIKEVTGVSDINEVIAKFQSQGDTLEHLTKLQESNEAKIESLKKQKLEIQKELEDLKFSGEAKQAHSIRALEEFKAHLSESKSSFVESKQKYERLLKVFTSAKAGVQHLNDKLEPIKLVIPVTQPDQSSKAVVVNDGTVVEVLQTCVKKLEMMATNLNSKELPEAPPKDPNQIQQPGESVGILNVNQTLLPAHNTRVKLRPLEFEEAEAEGILFNQMKRRMTMNAKSQTANPSRSRLHKCSTPGSRPNRQRRLKSQRRSRPKKAMIVAKYKPNLCRFEVSHLWPNSRMDWFSNKFPTENLTNLVKQAVNTVENSLDNVLTTEDPSGEDFFATMLGSKGGTKQKAPEKIPVESAEAAAKSEARGTKKGPKPAPTNSRRDVSPQPQNTVRSSSEVKEDEAKVELHEEQTPSMQVAEIAPSQPISRPNSPQKRPKSPKKEQQVAIAHKECDKLADSSTEPVQVDDITQMTAQSAPEAAPKSPPKQPVSNTSSHDRDQPAIIDKPSPAGSSSTDLQSLLHRREEEIVNAKKDVATLHAQLSELSEKLGASQVRITELETNQSQLEQRNTELEKSIRHAKTDYANLEKRVASSADGNQIATLTKALAEKEESIKGLLQEGPAAN